MLTIYKLQAQQVCGFGELFLSFGWNEAECAGRQWRGPCVQGTVRIQEEFRQQCKQFIDIGERSLRRRVAGDGYTGKEDQDMDFSTGYTDFGARQYSPTLRRWMTPDPLSEKYYGVSPYAFCNNNPVNFVDPDGRIIETASDLISLGLGVRSFIKNIKSGNAKEAILDDVGVAFDLAAVAIPVIPGGIGYLRQGARLINYADLAVDATKLADDLQNFEKAAEFGVDSYKNLRKSVISTYGTGSGLEVHHLVEKRFASKLGIKESDMPSIVLTKEEHKKFTEAWKKAIGYENSGSSLVTGNVNSEEILNAARNIYKDYPELLKAIEEIFK